MQQQADEDLASAWVKKMLEAQEQSQACLFKLEVELCKSDKMSRDGGDN